MGRKSKYIVLGVIILFFFLIACFLGFGIRNVSYCNGMLGIDYGVTTDGAYDYIELPAFKIIAKCGGYCMNPNINCSKCPPPNWNCP
jgi:hypothetical protein